MMITLRRLLPTTAVIACILFFSLFQHGDAIVCYQCNSEYDPRCGDPFDPYSLGTVNCSFQPRLEHLGNADPTLCRKTSQRIYGKIRVVRGCGFIKDPRDDKDCVGRSGTHDVHTTFCSCTTDLCNAATTPLANSPASLILGVLVAKAFVTFSIKQ
ncbi:uncharacterized protein LOC107220945 isoform X1 [Neodiprion lecontei]|uniref:Uncharacterized protein LOC107220945 isoform X1 n=1 Tax=Neodiprion lecontei TaxID=441921 RepID=A0A6J0BKU1_NEOLC|nr:uncharacterized protein LOC107220945 isoform X1 [Neodiprion lecontei]XP_046424558.1 uncharacterized protein LOC124181812 isoform X1 [Neodiprion fabricii]